MYSTRLNEDKYPVGVTVRRLNRFYIGQRVIYSGRTNYSYGDEKSMRCVVSRERGTVISKSDNNVVVELDEYRKPYITRFSKFFGGGIYVIPPKQIALVTECDLACGCKVLESLY